MSQINELLEKLCPNGVEFKKLEDLLDYEQPTQYIVTSTKYDDKYKTPVLTAGKTFILGYTNEENGIYKASKEKPVIIFDDFTTGFHWVDFDFKVKSSAMKMLKPKYDKINFRYVYYVMNTIKFTPWTHVRHWIKIYSQFTVPFPPLEIQCEIVRMLDKFTELIALLKAELKARKQQYEYYLEQLLSRDYNVVKLEEVCNICSGGTPCKRKIEYWKNGTIKWLGSTVCKNKKYIDEVTGYITEIGLKKSAIKIMKERTTLIAMVGTTIGKVSFLNFKATTNQNVACLYPKNENRLNPDYLYFACKNLYPKFLQFSHGKFSIANLRFIKNLEIPFPDIQEQNKIVELLDKFEKLCNDLTEGIPAEIEARQKQYEYYRDKILTFKELKSE